MSDLISRQAAIDAIDRERKNKHLFNTAEDGLLEARGVINTLPSAQPDLIACGDCKHYICHDRRCGYWNHGVKPLMWCSQAERRIDGN